MTAKANAVESKTNAVNAADNTNLEALRDQAYDAAKADAEKLLGDAVSQNKKIKENCILTVMKAGMENITPT